ncbi:response regulator [Anaerolineales bacterium]
MQNGNSAPKTSTILIVDDDDLSRTLLHNILKHHYEVFTASNGHEAIEILDNQSIDLILLDIMMPYLNGFEVLSYVRTHTLFTRLPVILISARSNSHDVVRGLQEGANDYISKPIDFEIVLARVKTQLMIKQLMDERERTIEELEASHRIRAKLFHIVSHDINNPLGNIRMAEYILGRKLSNMPETQTELMTIRESLSAMEEIVSNFMELVDMWTGRIRIKEEETLIHRVIYQTVFQYELRANEKGIQINIDGVRESSLITDGSRLGQILSNFISNAIKYSPANTVIRIITEDREDGLRIYVKDQGPGIPENEEHLLFKEFSRLSNVPTGGESSSGLGLWIVQYLSNLMDGQCGVEKPVEGGSNFWVELPKKKEALLKFMA